MTYVQLPDTQSTSADGTIEYEWVIVETTDATTVGYEIDLTGLSILGSFQSSYDNRKDRLETWLLKMKGFDPKRNKYKQMNKRITSKAYYSQIIKI